MADRMVALAAAQPGFLGMESVREDLGITVLYWESLESITNWKRNAEHLEAQRLGKKMVLRFSGTGGKSGVRVWHFTSH
ncbi:antibiotic biosynthesis monooxygenase family protein [Marinobacter guineae]|uniref:antibiotic biosynthesis monooxygenase family protein n=1 Tax=Marinobacter guineae TaxID=432303 RepID=UPI0026933A49